jgi:predicted nucleic acid-binding protein
MPRTVCIDSNIVVWGIKKQATKGQEGMIPMAEAFIENLQTEKAILLIPAPVVTEILAPVPVPDHAKLTDLISRIFRVVPVDTIIAMKAAELWHSKPDWKQVYQKDGQEGMRNRFKYDILIAATAIVRNANCIYTHDDRLINLCNGLIPASKIPPIGLSAQTELFNQST